MDLKRKDRKAQNRKTNAKAAPAMTSRGKWTPATTRDKAVRTEDTAAISGKTAGRAVYRQSQKRAQVIKNALEVCLLGKEHPSSCCTRGTK